MTTPRDPSATVTALFRPFPAPSNPVQSDVYLAQQMLLVNQQLPMGVINVLAAILMVIALYATAPLWALATWFGIIGLFSVVQIYGFLRHRNRPSPTQVSGQYLKKSEFGAFAMGLVWGAPILFLAQDLTDAERIFIYGIQTGMSAGVMSILTPLPRHSVRFLLPCLAPAIFYAPLYGGAYVMPAAIMFVVYCIALTRSSIHSYRMLASNITKTHDSQRARKHLNDAIEATNDAFAAYGVEGNLVLANSKHHDLFGEDLDRLPQDVEPGQEEVQIDGHWLRRGMHGTALGGVVLVHTDITALKRRESDLEAAQKEAVEADAAKGRFLSTMSHELRTPLNVILGFSRLMASDSNVRLSQAEISEYADSINKSGAHLLNLIDDIIDYSKVGLDKYLIEPSVVDVRALIAKSVSLAGEFENVGLLSDIDVQVAPEIGDLRVDRSIFRRVTMNLLTNAMRFRGRDPRIVVRVALSPQGAPFVAVRDFGRGIAEADQEKVFEAFYQIDNGHNRAQGGTGLGLTLSRHLARLHGGDVILKSRLGVGTTATFVLPTSCHIPRQRRATAIERPAIPQAMGKTS
ncbi:MAG: ATP-binding protein [Pseudomonadota bacterium]